jgi:hypothetical protein
MIEHQQRYVVIHEDKEDLKELLTQVGIPAGKVELTEENERELRSILGELKQHPFNKADGEVRAIIGNVHFPLRKTLFSAFVLTLKLSIGTAHLAIEPVTGGIDLTINFIEAAQKAQELFTRLSEDELEVYEAILAVQNRSQSPQEARASLPEIEGIFAQRGEQGPDLEEVLDDLRSKEVIEKEGSGGTRRYRVVP